MKSNQKNMREGVCKYCGQIRMVTSYASAAQDDVTDLSGKYPRYKGEILELIAEYEQRQKAGSTGFQKRK